MSIFPPSCLGKSCRCAAIKAWGCSGVLLCGNKLQRAVVSPCLLNTSAEARRVRLSGRGVQPAPPPPDTSLYTLRLGNQWSPDPRGKPVHVEPRWTCFSSAHACREAKRNRISVHMPLHFHSVEPLRTMPCTQNNHTNIGSLYIKQKCPFKK